MKIGTQIIYVPIHIQISDINHSDAEPGFVYGPAKHKDYIFCRYWSKSNPNELRTKANSEATPIWRLVIKNTRAQELVNETIRKIEWDKNQTLITQKK